MDPEIFCMVGEALYGSHWRSAIARDLSVADRTVRRWTAGRTPIPEGISTELRTLCETRTADIKAAMTHLSIVY